MVTWVCGSRYLGSLLAVGSLSGVGPKVLYLYQNGTTTSPS